VAGNSVPVDRSSRGLQVVITAAPSPNWRMRLSAASVKGTVKSTTTYQQDYNDQFYANGAGQVTYANGTLVYVRPTFNVNSPVATSTTAGAFPLTIAMMSTPGNVYYANPAPLSGAINASSNAARVLRVVDPVHGAILTGATGLPISNIQINPGFVPPGEILTTKQGDATTGYPELSLNYTNTY